MDAIAGLLDGPRARDAFLLRSSMDPPWCLRIQDEAPLTVVAMIRGEAWLIHDDAEPLSLHAGDVAIIRGPEPYTMADDPDTPVQAIIHPGQRCTTVSGEDLAEQWNLGVRTWGNTADGASVMLTGTYQLSGEVSQRLLRALPIAIVLREGEWDCPVVPLLADEIVKDEPGQEAVLDRLLDLLLIAVLRAALARRFHELVGEPPMTFLTGWRIALAADLLREPGATIASVAEQVGYGSPFALSTAFKRVRGISPKQHRAAA